MRKRAGLVCLSILCIVLCFVLAACNASSTPGDFTNPGDSLGGGGVVDNSDIPDTADTADFDAQIQVADGSITEADKTEDYADLEYTIVDLSAGDYTITASGNYVVTGNAPDARIILGKKDIEIHVFLQNAVLSSIYTDKKPAFSVLTLIGENEMTGNSVASTSDAKGTLYVKNNLTINGSGTLNVSSESFNAIHCTGVLKILNCTVNASAYKHAVRGNDAVIIENAVINATTETGDGIQTDNETVDMTVGYIYISDSDIVINAGDDGISAATVVRIVSGNISITTNGGAPGNVTETSSDNADGKGIKAGAIKYEITEDQAAAESAKENVTVTVEDGVYTAEITDPSYYAISVEGGTLLINSNDDAVHSDGSIKISGGTFEIKTGDDGIHADNVCCIKDGIIDIQRCYEGIEGAKVIIDGGEITVVSADDGINAADGSSNAPGQSNSNCYVIINGGNIAVSSSGDGIDSNGVLIINGGNVFVDGPVSGADAALDSDGGILVNGGTLVAAGSLGMVETPATNSQQNVISYASNSSVSAGSEIKLTDADGNSVLTFTLNKNCQSIIISAPGLTIGKSYSLYNGSALLKTFTINGTITSIGTQTGGNQPGSGGRPGWGFR